MILTIQDTEEGAFLEIPEEIMQALDLKIGDIFDIEVLEIDGVKQAVLSPQRAIPGKPCLEMVPGMHNDLTKAWSEDIIKAIQHAHTAHAQHGNTPDDSVRFHDHITPYIVHPIWCAASLLQEPLLPLALRQTGSIALLWHDTLEDTSLPLPDDTSLEVSLLVKGMSFTSFVEELTEIWNRPIEIKLLKLYDKVSNLLDGIWMKPEKWNIYVEHTLRLADEVELQFGELGIVKIARAIACNK